MDDIIAMRTYTVYREVSGPPGQQFSVREFRITRPPDSRPVPGPVLGTAATLEQARDLVPALADVCLQRSEDDDPSIVETWI
jgi:hypothetical protein